MWKETSWAWAGQHQRSQLSAASNIILVFEQKSLLCSSLSQKSIIWVLYGSHLNIKVLHAAEQTGGWMAGRVGDYNATAWPLILTSWSLYELCWSGGARYDNSVLEFKLISILKKYLIRIQSKFFKKKNYKLLFNKLCSFSSYCWVLSKWVQVSYIWQSFWLHLAVLILHLK